MADLYIYLYIIVAIGLLSNLLPKALFKIILFIIAIVCLREALLGISYFIKVWKYNSTLYPVTGSFENPGPYGGFLAVCISLIVSTYIKYFDYSYETNYSNRNKNPSEETNFLWLVQKVIYWSVFSSGVFALVIIPATKSRSALLALVISFIFIILRTKRIKKVIKVELKHEWIWLVPLLILFCIGAYCFKKPSADGRLFMDKISILSMAKNNWKGVGLNHFGAAYGQAQADYFKKQMMEDNSDDLDWNCINEHDRLTSDCPEYAFNDFLQIGIEYGLVVMLLFIGVLVGAIVTSMKRGTIWCFGLISFMVFAMFSYPLQCVQFKLLFPLLIACCLFDRHFFAVNTSSLTNSKESTILVLIIEIISFISLTPLVIKEENLHKKRKEVYSTWNDDIRKWYKMEFYDYVVEDCDTLLAYLQDDRYFLFEYGNSLSMTGNYSKSDSILKMGAQISSDPMFWNIMGNNSLMQGDYRKAEEHYKKAFYMVPNRLYPLFLLAKLYYAEQDTVRFLEMADKVDSFIPKVESTKTQSMRSEILKLKESVIK